LRFRDRINLNVIDAAAKKPVLLALSGPLAPQLAGSLDPDQSAPEGTLRVFGSLAEAQKQSAAHCVLYAGEPGETVSPQAASRPVFFIERAPAGSQAHSGDVGSPSGNGRALRHYRLVDWSAGELRKRLLPEIVAEHAGSEVALAAALPLFRASVANKLTDDCAMRSLQVAAASALADHVPIIGLLTGGIASATDTVAITGMQINMLLHIAAAYGKKPEFARILELVPVIGGGYAWRALARELSGFIPVAGVVIKAAVAYAGTFVVGQAAAHYYETGNPMTSDKITAMYREASSGARRIVQDLLLRRK